MPRPKPALAGLLVTCEHGGNGIPARYAPLFAEAQGVLATHRGLDIGALAVAKALARDLGAPLCYSTVSRLLIDLNRSLGRKGLYSEFSSELDAEQRDVVEERYYLPYRREVEQKLRALVAVKKRVLHLSVHSFTPVMRGVVRNAEIGLLYDPRRKLEAETVALLAQLLEAAIHDAGLGWRLRRNYPYRGTSDGFTTALRRMFPADSYAGIEIEMNQALVASAAGRRAMGRLLKRVITAETLSFHRRDAELPPQRR